MRTTVIADEYDRVAHVFHALSDPVRLEMVAQLFGGRERACHEIAVPVTKATFSHHLQILERAGIVEVRAGSCERREGNKKFLSLSTDPQTKEVLRWIRRTLKRSQRTIAAHPFAQRVPL